MALDRDKVKEVAFLARIRVADSELDGLAGELNNIIGWVEQLAEVDTDGVEPMTSVMEGMELPRRPDEVNDGHYPDRVLKNAPEREDNFYAVPKVVE